MGLLILSLDYKPKKSCHCFELLAPNRYVLDLSNEVLNIDFDQGAAKISEVKVGVGKKYRPICLVRTRGPGVGQVGRYFFRTPTLTCSIFVAP